MLRSKYSGAAIQDVWGVFWVLGVGWGRGGVRDLVYFNSGYHDLGVRAVNTLRLGYTNQSVNIV